MRIYADGSEQPTPGMGSESRWMADATASSIAKGKISMFRILSLDDRGITGACAAPVLDTLANHIGYATAYSRRCGRPSLPAVSSTSRPKAQVSIVWINVPR